MLMVNDSGQEQCPLEFNYFIWNQLLPLLLIWIKFSKYKTLKL